MTAMRSEKTNLLHDWNLKKKALVTFYHDCYALGNQTRRTEDVKEEAEEDEQADCG